MGAALAQEHARPHRFGVNSVQDDDVALLSLKPVYGAALNLSPLSLIASAFLEPRPDGSGLIGIRCDDSHRGRTRTHRASGEVDTQIGRGDVDSRLSPGARLARCVAVGIQ